MLRSPRGSSLMTGIVAAALVAVPAAAAHAAPACPVQAVGPASVTLGLEKQAVQFWVQTACDGTEDVDWELFSDQYQGSGASWIMLRNWDRPGGEKYSFVEEPHGFFTIDPLHSGVHPGNAMAGPHPLSANAFVDEDGNGFEDWLSEPLTFGQGTFTMKRATAFEDFTLTPDPVTRHETLTATGQLKRADWDTDIYAAVSGEVSLQYQRDGRDRWKTVATGSDDGAGVSLTVRAKHSGQYRLHYDGDDISGSTDSVAEAVDVTR